MVGMVARYTPWNINMEPQNHLFENEKSSSKHELIFRAVTWLLLTVKTTSKFQQSGERSWQQDLIKNFSAGKVCDFWATKKTFDISLYWLFHRDPYNGSL